MAEIRIGHGKDLDSYKTESIEDVNLDIGIMLENGKKIEIYTRKHGFRISYNGKDLKDIDY